MELCKEYEKENELANPALEIIKKCVNSKIFLVAIVAFTVAVILNIINLFVYSEFSVAQFFNIFLIDVYSRLGINIEFFSYELLGILSFIFDDIFSVIPSVVLAVGMWNTYFSLQGKPDCDVKMVGIKTIRVMMIVFMVFAWWALIVSVVNVVVLSLYFGNGQFTVEALKMLFQELLPFYLSVIFIIVYYFVLFNFLGGVKQMIKTGVVDKKIALFIPVATIALGAVSVCLTLYYGYNEIVVPYGDIADSLLLILINLISALATFSFGKIMLSFRKSVNDLINIQTKRA